MKTMPVTGTQFDLLVEEGADLGAFFEDAPIPDHIADTPEALLDFIAGEHAALALPLATFGVEEGHSVYVGDMILGFGLNEAFAEVDALFQQSQKVAKPQYIKPAVGTAKGFGSKGKMTPFGLRSEHARAPFAGFGGPPSGKSAKK